MSLYLSVCVYVCMSVCECESEVFEWNKFEVKRERVRWIERDIRGGGCVNWCGRGFYRVET